MLTYQHLESQKQTKLYSNISNGEIASGNVFSKMSILTRPRCVVFRADFRLVPNQWETSLQSNVVSHWLGANLELALCNASYAYWSMVMGRKIETWLTKIVNEVLILTTSSFLTCWPPPQCDQNSLVSLPFKPVTLKTPSDSVAARS